MIGGLFGWLIGKAMSIAGSGIVQKAVEIYNRSQDNATKLAEVGAGLERAHLDAAVSLQTQKMNWPVFWIIVCVMIGAPAFQLWGITLYNVFWHTNGIWPQGWDIAAYPPSVAPWVTMSIEWLYNPVGVPGTIASAWLAGRVSGRK